MSCKSSWRHSSIRVECFTEARHRSPVYPEWCSENPSDAVFGAKIGFFQQDLWTSLVTVWNEEDSGDKLWNHILHSASSKRPTRFVIITSIQLAAQVLSKSNQVLELAQIPQGFLPPESDVHRIREPLFAAQADPVSIILVLNKESMLLDPIDWPSLKSDLSNWAAARPGTLLISEHTNNRFRERAATQHRQRQFVQQQRNSSIYHFFDGQYPCRNETDYLMRAGIPPDFVKLINKVNNHDRLLSVLGIMPNQLREIMKSSLDNWEDAWHDLNKTIFWKGYHPWKKRKALVSHLWKHILPVEWNKSSHTKAKKRVMQDSLCKDPFHYFQKLSAYSTQKITKCSCSKVLLTKRSRTGDIRSFLTKVPRIIDSDPVFHINRPVLDVLDTMPFVTREEKIRNECDRKKKRRI